MRINPEVSQASVVAIGHFNPLILRPDWLRDKELIVGSDSEQLKIEVIHAELVILKFPWGRLQCDLNQFVIAVDQEPMVSASDFFVRCFQTLPETPIRAVGINREIHFPAGSEQNLHKVGDTLAPKEFWGPLLKSGDKRAGGLRALIMEQRLVEDNRKMRLDGRPGNVQFRVEPSVRADVPFGIFCQLNDHFDLILKEKPADGRKAAELVSEVWAASMERAESWADHVMSIIHVDAN